MSNPVVKCEACGRDKWAGQYGNICMGTGTRHCQETELARLRRSATDLAARLARAVASLDHIVHAFDAELPNLGRCELVGAIEKARALVAAEDGKPGRVDP